MAVEVKFGNLGIDEIERDLGIKLTEADRKFLQETRQEQVMNGEGALKMPSRSWHFFDMPRVLELGSYSFYLELASCFSLVSSYRECCAIGYALDRNRKRGSSITLRSP